MTFEIIRTGSQGNAVLLNGSLLIDCGVPMKLLEPYKRQLQLVLLTHIHSDHFNSATVRALASERPTLRWCCCDWMVEPLLQAGVDARRIDVISPGYCFIYKGICTVKPERLVHDVPNAGWHIWKEKESAFYATDTGTLDGISAPGYDLYLIEANHKRAEIEEKIRQKDRDGEFSYERRAARTHLSQEQAYDWLAENIGPNSRYVFLHQHQDR